MPYRLITFLFLAFIGYKGYGLYQAKEVRKAGAEMVLKGRVAVYGAKNESSTLLLMEKLRLRGVSPEFRPINDQGAAIELARRFNKTVLTLPSLELNGDLLTAEKVNMLLQTMTVHIQPLKPEPYVYVYGPNPCSKTSGKLEEYKTKGLPAEYRDVNHPVYGAEIMSRMDAVKLAKPDWPLVDVNGKIMAAPTAAEVLAVFKPEKI
ncbi:MAG TPA: hypothetical protein VJB59_05370 [Bdellovibrionota bacterium]|nr:hypothetical protein [Bdellovibrionota bacterium]